MTRKFLLKDTSDHLGLPLFSLVLKWFKKKKEKKRIEKTKCLSLLYHLLNDKSTSRYGVIKLLFCRLVIIYFHGFFTRWTSWFQCKFLWILFCIVLPGELFVCVVVVVFFFKTKFKPIISILVGWVMQCLAAISNKLSYIQLPPIQASQFYPNEIKLKARIFHFAMLKLTQKPPLTYGMVQWLVVLGTTKRQQQERQKQTSNRFNHMCKTRLNATQQKTTISSFFFKT